MFMLLVWLVGEDAGGKGKLLGEFRVTGMDGEHSVHVQVVHPYLWPHSEYSVIVKAVMSYLLYW
jgi:hypothetical protein